MLSVLAARQTRGSWSGPHCWVPERTSRIRPPDIVLAGPMADSPNRSRTSSIARLASLQRPPSPIRRVEQSSNWSCSAGVANLRRRQPEQPDPGR